MKPYVELKRGKDGKTAIILNCKFKLYYSEEELTPHLARHLAARLLTAAKSAEKANKARESKE